MLRNPTPPGVDRVDVITAAEMHDATLERAATSDVLVMAAAVADFRPAEAAVEKIKKADVAAAGGSLSVPLEPTADILAELGARRSADQTLVGFAAETNDVETHAARKLADKGVQLLVANDVSSPGAGFEGDTNEVILLGPHRRHPVRPPGRQA